MIGAAIGLALGIATILLGIKGLKPEGIPLSSTKKLTGRSGQIVGVICIVLGGFFILGSLLSLLLVAFAQN